MQNGIFIDLNNAPSNPPMGTYNYVVIIAPTIPGAPPVVNGLAEDKVHVDAI
ncbi:MAG: hypothetical protein QGM50_06240 [Anaerolineae bacterium]|nr:hypothetical protein [Anaerolineae bacterium]